MYKVFVNDKVICFTNNVEISKEFSDVLVLKFYQIEITSFLIELVGETTRTKAVIVFIPDFKEGFESFKSYFKLIQAAGGIVTNTNDEKLFIFRLNKWDLPKGKIEKNEEIEDAAIREVEEECGINGLTIQNKLSDTYHIYEHKGKLILKQTFWFKMTTDFNSELIPQIEENITKVEWLNNDEIESKVKINTYKSIEDLLKRIT